MRDGTVSADHQEVEWQFDVPDVRPVERWLARRSGDGKLSVAPSGEQELADTYLDTGDWRIHRAGYALRIRRRGGGEPEATMKLLAPAEGALRRRREISEPLDVPGALSSAPGPVGERVRVLAGPKALGVLFEVRTRRVTYALLLDGEEVGEVALDETEIPVGSGEPTVLRRVEVEVRPAQLSNLAAFVEELSEGCRLSPAGVSKFEAGLLARGLSPPGPPELGPTGVDASLTAGEAAFAIMREQLLVALDREPGARIGEVPDELHDMRVASRRLRAATEIFRDVLPARSGRYREDLGWISSFLDEVRDLDVRLGQLEAWISGVRPEDGDHLSELRAVLEQQRREARKGMLRALDSRRYRRFVESFSAFLKRGPSGRPPAARRPVLAVAPEAVCCGYRGVRELGDRVTADSPDKDLQELRRRGKMLRYALEFFAEMYGGPAKDLIEQLKAFLGVLGDHRNAVVVAGHLRELAGGWGRKELSPRTVFVMGGIAHRHEARARELRAKLPGAYGKIRGKRWERLEKAMETSRPPEGR